MEGLQQDVLGDVSTLKLVEAGDELLAGGWAVFVRREGFVYRAVPS